MSFFVWLSGERVIANNGKYKTSSMASKLPSIFAFPTFMELPTSQNSAPSATLQWKLLTSCFLNLVTRFRFGIYPIL